MRDGNWWLRAYEDNKIKSLEYRICGLSPIQKFSTHENWWLRDEKSGENGKQVNN